MANPRTRARIEARIKERVAHCVEFELNDPRAAFVTITKVEISTDLATARVFYSVFGTEGERSRVAHMLESATGFVRTRVAKVLRVRRVPRVLWVYDDTVEYQAKMDAAIRGAIEGDRNINPDAHPGLQVTEEDAEEDELDREYLDFLDAQEEEGDSTTA